MTFNICHGEDYQHFLETKEESVNLEKLGDRTIIIDADVIQADGGTRCASICGGYVALSMAINRLIEKELLQENPIIEPR